MKKHRSAFSNWSYDLSVTKGFRTLILSLALLLTGFMAQATHYRYGTINYTLLGKPHPDSCTIEVTVTQAWRTSAFFFGTPPIGATTGNVFTDLVLETSGGAFVESRAVDLTVTSVNPVDDWFFGEYKTTFTIHESEAYLLWYEGCCRISTLANNHDEDFRSETIVTPCDGGNESPKGTIVPIVKLPEGAPAAMFPVSAADPNGDPLFFRLATPAEAENDGGIPSSINAPGFTVTPTGTGMFSTVGKAVGDLYNAWVAIEDTAGSKIILDFLIEVVDSSAAPIFDYAVTPDPLDCIEARPGDTVKFTVKAYDPDAGDLVSISAVGVPLGSSFSPPLPTTGGNPDSTVFMWMPDTGDIGATVISFTAEDTSGVSTSTTVCIIVSLKPIFAVPPTPPEGIPLVAECGDTVKFPVEAYDPDPGDSVQIFKVEGKVPPAPKGPLFPGAMFMPLPTPWGNPTGGMFSWPIDSSLWGPHHVIFSAKDGFGDIAEHEVPILINNPPKFLSSPATMAYVDSMYTYKIIVDDKDTAHGDSVEILGMTIPTWLTLIDSGNGMAWLTGTPGLGDVGMHPVSINAEDVYHHLNGTTNQAFMIEVKVHGGDTLCSHEAVAVMSDSSWFESTVVDLAYSGDWTGEPALPAEGSFILPAVVGQPYAWNNLRLVPGTMPVSAENNVRYFRTSFMMSDPSDVSARLRMYMDDCAEVYINGHLLCREENIDPQNFKGAYHDMYISYTGAVTNGFMGGQTFDYAVGVMDLDAIITPGANVVTIALRNLRKPSNKGGFSFMMELANCGDSVVIPPKQLLYASELENVELYPNPTSGWVSVALPEILGGGDHQLLLYDMNGRLLQEISVSSETGGGITDLNLSDYSSGIYILKVQSGDESVMERITKL